ncbi:DNA ligase [Helicobacter sp. 16-1353]|nr:DNA ligase [Helicobacter sp. 16-1353]
MLLSEYDKNFIKQEGLENFLISEKLDGIRAFWDGKNLYSRNGNKLNPPQWFIKDFPPFSIDGELWHKRDSFSYAVKIINTDENKILWNDLRFYIFDVPSELYGLLNRLKILESYLQNHPNKYIKIIPQMDINSFDELDSRLDLITNAKGEGLVLRHKNKPYIKGRSKYDLKLKKFLSADCKVVGYTQGKGKFINKVGSIICKDKIMEFKIGSGLSDDFRENPPPIGSIVEYKYSGKTTNNIPRFPIFLRIKE